MKPLPLRSNAPDIERPAPNGKPSPANWAYVPKNKRTKGKVKRVNKWQAMHECKVGYGSAFAYMDGTPMSNDDMLRLLGTRVVSDPLLELLA